MEPEVAVHADEGSPGTQYALAALAHTLNINENVLKTALNGAFDLLPMTAGRSMLALHLSFKQLSYHIDGKTLYQIMIAFRQLYGPALANERGECCEKRTKVLLIMANKTAQSTMRPLRQSTVNPVERLKRPYVQPATNTWACHGTLLQLSNHRTQPTHRH
jgi:hypothetical protein